MILKNRYFIGCVVLLMAASTAVAGNPASSREKERELIEIIQSDAPRADKAIPCKQLAIYGTKDAVPALAALLPDEQLASWARTALEAIPDPAADAALREAMGKVEGRLLVGVINSIAVRRDAQAVDGLTKRLKDADAEVASAAAVALGRIGGDQAATVLKGALAQAPAAVRSAVAEGCILCAEKYLAQRQYADAVKLYDTVRQTTLPKQRVLEATRGAILARRSDGIPLLIEQLRSTDRRYFNIGLRTARELEGRDVTDALAVEMDRSEAGRQALLLLAIADRNDAAALPVVVKALKSGPKTLRIEAAEVLQRLGDVSCIPALLDAATANDAELAQTAKTTLTRLHGENVDADLLARMSQAAGKQRQALIELAGRRLIDAALPAAIQSLEDGDADIRAAAIQAVGILGKSRQARDLVKLLEKTPSGTQRGEIEKALMAISGRSGEVCVPYLLPLTRSDDSGLRMIGLHALVAAGGPEALATVEAAMGDREESVRDEAVRVLSTWPNNWPEDADAGKVLLTLARSGGKTLHKVLGLRGYLQYVRGDKGLSAAEKVAKVVELLPLIQRPEEKRLAVAVVGTVRSSGALELLAEFTADPAVTEEACSAIVGLTTGRNARGLPRQQRKQALQVVVEKSRNAATKQRAEQTLRQLR